MGVDQMGRHRENCIGASALRARDDRYLLAVQTPALGAGNSSTLEYSVLLRVSRAFAVNALLAVGTNILSTFE